MQCQSAVMAGAEAEQELVSKLKKDVNLINAKVDATLSTLIDIYCQYFLMHLHFNCNYILRNHLQNLKNTFAKLLTMESRGTIMGYLSNWLVNWWNVVKWREVWSINSCCFVMVISMIVLGQGWIASGWFWWFPYGRTFCRVDGIWARRSA